MPMKVLGTKKCRIFLLRVIRICRSKDNPRFIKNIIRFFLGLFPILFTQIADAQYLIGQTISFVGIWNMHSIEVSEVLQQDFGDNGELSHIKGRIHHIDTQMQRIKIGPFSIDWDEFTEFEGMLRNVLRLEQPVTVVGRLIESTRLTAVSIAPISMSSSHLEVTGVVTERNRRSDGSLQLTVLGVPVEISRWNYFLGMEPEKRPDDIDTEEMVTTYLNDKPLSISLECEINLEFLKDYELGHDAADDLLFNEQVLTVRGVYPLTGDISLLLGFELFNEGEYETEVGNHETFRGIGREEMWLFIGNLFESGFSLQIGRLPYEDVNQWWWGDEELDAIKLIYERHRFHTQFSVAEELAKSTTAESRIDPEHEDLLRVLGQTSLTWAENQRLDIFYLYQNDHSKQYRLGEPVRKSLEDPIDADLFWIGCRASGQLNVEASGEFEYWLDVASVFGKEDLFEFEETEEGLNQVSSHIRRDVTGWAFDAGFTWWSRLPGRPFLMLDYARGSGDHNKDTKKDKSFRQTGLHKNENRYVYYGILLEPELSNLRICTASSGFRLWESSSIELVYHDYRQVKSSSFFRGALIEASPDGSSREIGEEWDLVVILDDWDNLELKLFGALFSAGSAFGSLSGENAYYTGFEMTYMF